MFVVLKNLDKCPKTKTAIINHIISYMWRVEFLWLGLEIGLGLLMIMTLLGLAKSLKEKDSIVNDDEIFLNRAKQELDNYDHYETKSIESLGKNTTVIANTGSLEIAIDIDNKTGKTLSKEKIARQ